MMHEQNSKNLIAGAFRDLDAADRAYVELRERGYAPQEIHVVMNDKARDQFLDRGLRASHENDHSLIGVLAGAAGVAVPVLGMTIMGPLAGVLAQETDDGLAGVLVGAGMREEWARVFEQDVIDGIIVVGAMVRNEDDARFFQTRWSALGEHVYS